MERVRKWMVWFDGEGKVWKEMAGGLAVSAMIAVVLTLALIGLLSLLAEEAMGMESMAQEVVDTRERATPVRDSVRGDAAVNNIVKKDNGQVVVYTPRGDYKVSAAQLLIERNDTLQQ